MSSVRVILRIIAEDFPKHMSLFPHIFSHLFVLNDL